MGRQWRFPSLLGVGQGRSPICRLRVGSYLWATLITGPGHPVAMRFDHRIVLALDDLDTGGALRVAGELSHGVDAVKVGYPLVLTEGLGVVGRLAEVAPVICDFKVADIPAVCAMIVDRAVDAGASAVIVHGFVGEDSVRAAVEAAGDRGVIVVTEMSHPGALDYIQDASESIGALARRVGAMGIIAPATRPERIAHLRGVVGPEVRIITPGVGTQGGGAGAAVAAGADAVIVGRSLYRAEEPKGVLDGLAREISSSL